MDGSENAALAPSLLDKPIPIPRLRASKWSGWLIGAVCGVLASLWAFPSVRYTLTAQMQFALAEDSVPWLSSLDAQRTAREVPLLDRVASGNPDDYLLQVGRATAMATLGGARPPGRPAVGHATLVDHNDQTLGRLGAITRMFATTPGAYAHLARYLMADRIRIHRPETAGPNAAIERGLQPEEGSAPGPNDLRIMLWALNSGERLDRDNAFWPAMIAATCFAANQDENALTALGRASRKPRWDAYIYEEVLGQWRLYSAAYGDHGATQQIGPLSLVVFPHLHEIRRMAEIARWRADRSARQGRNSEAARIRRNLAHLGVNLRDNAGWAFEALYGTDLFFISCTDSDSKMAPSRIRTPLEWEPQSVKYHRLLRGLGREYEFRLVRSEVEASCDLRKRVDLARYDASYPGIPPGIPLMPLFGNWMGGICLVQQALGLLLAVALARLWEVFGARYGERRNLLRTVALALIAIGTVVGGAMFFTALPTPRMAGLLLTGLTLLSLAGLEALWRAQPWLPRYVSRRDGRYVVHRAGPSRRSDAGVEPDPSQKPMRWTRGTTIRMLLLIVLPYLVVLYTNRGELSGLHPVAILLTSLTGIPRAGNIRDAIELALLASALPLLLPLTCGLWGLYRGSSPAASALLGLRRLALPTLVCLVAAYAVLLNRMLVLDAEASQAIQKAAQNDRQWVLTHGPDNPF